jgi:hypothetical protein
VPAPVFTAPSLSPFQARRAALAAGGLYLLIIVLGIGAEAAIRLPLIEPGDATATAANIAGHETLFRLSMAADALMAVADVALAVLLFVLLAPAGAMLAATATAFRLVQTAVIAGNLANQQAALMLVTGGIDPATAEPLALQAMALHAKGYDMGLIFFGVNAVLLGLLLIRSAEFGAWLGWLMAAAGAVYLGGSFLGLLAPGLSETFAPTYAIPVLAETALAVRLVGMGLPRRARGAPVQEARP